MTNPPKPSSLLRKERILVVDSEEPVCEIISAILYNAGYEHQAVHSGAEALAALQAPGEFQLLLTEIMMYGMDGFELMEHVQRDYPDLPLVFVTAVQDEAVRKFALSSGACGYVSKPFDSEQLLNAVQEALRSR
jgi:CheY-like chemotaxis protein